MKPIVANSTTSVSSLNWTTQHKLSKATVAKLNEALWPVKYKNYLKPNRHNECAMKNQGHKLFYNVNKTQENITAK